MRPRLDSQNPAIAEASVYLGLRGEGDYRGGTCRVTLFGSPQPAANLTQEPLKVVWTD
jgi:hypothetical protein